MLRVRVRLGVGHAGLAHRRQHVGGGAQVAWVRVRGRARGRDRGRGRGRGRGSVRVRVRVRVRLTAVFGMCSMYRSSRVPLAAVPLSSECDARASSACRYSRTWSGLGLG